MTIQDKIEKANNLKEINVLRMEVAEAKNGAILKQWQTKFWALKQCPTCGKAL